MLSLLHISENKISRSNDSGFLTLGALEELQEDAEFLHIRIEAEPLESEFAFLDHLIPVNVSGRLLRRLETLLPENILVIILSNFIGRTMVVPVENGCHSENFIILQGENGFVEASFPSQSDYYARTLLGNPENSVQGLHFPHWVPVLIKKNHCGAICKSDSHASSFQAYQTDHCF